MPARVIVWIVAALALVAAGVVLLMPRDDAATSGPEGSPTATFAGDVPPPAAGGGGNGAPVGADASAAVPVALVGDIQAFAAARSPVIPPTDGLGTLATVTAAEDTVTFVVEVAIDGATYETPAERTVLTRGLVAVPCDDGTCFETEAVLVEEACADADLVGLLRRGAKAAYVYLDATGRELGTVAISAANCPA